MSKTLDQKIAAAQQSLARLKERQRSVDTRQKIVVGAAVISQALKSPEQAQQLLDILVAEPLRDHDKVVVNELIARLRAMASHDRPGEQSE